MGFMKRLGEVLTPPPHVGTGSGVPTPRPRSATRVPAAPALTDDDISAQLRMLVRALINVESSDERMRARARTQLTELAHNHGAYATAAKIRMVLETMVCDPQQSARYDFERVHVLLGEFVFQHLFNEIATMEQGSRPLGPNIFSTYCGDLIEALCTGRGPLAALEMGIHITERCLLNAADSRERRAIYLQLAEAASRCTRDQLEHAMQRPHRHQSTPPPRPASIGSDTQGFSRGSQCVAYARELYARVARIREEFGALPATPALSRAELRALANEGGGRLAANPELMLQLVAHLQYIQAALGIARNSEYLPFMAHLEERGARTLMARVRLEGETPEVRERCRAAYESAARHLEAHGDREGVLGLAPLSAQRYTKALELCTMAANTSQASLLQEKLAAVGR